MKYAACLVLVFALGCGSASGPLGVCYHLPSETDGKPDPDVVVWRPCENLQPDDYVCHTHILDRSEEHFVSESVVMTEDECYK